MFTFDFTHNFCIILNMAATPPPWRILAFHPDFDNIITKQFCMSLTLSSQILKLILVYCLLSPFLFYLWYWHLSSLHILVGFSMSCLTFSNSLSEISFIVKFLLCTLVAVTLSYFIWKNITLVLVCVVVISGTAASVQLP